MNIIRNCCNFDKEMRHTNARIVDAGIMYKDPVNHSIVIIMINQAIKIDSMTNNLVYSMQCHVYHMVIKKCPKFLSHRPTEEDHALLVHNPDGCSPTITILLSLNSVKHYFKPRCPSCAVQELDQHQIPPPFQKTTTQSLNFLVFLSGGWHG